MAFVIVEDFFIFGANFELIFGIFLKWIGQEPISGKLTHKNDGPEIVNEEMSNECSLKKFFPEKHPSRLSIKKV